MAARVISSAVPHARRVRDGQGRRSRSQVT